jgi:rubrerythrin
MDAETMHRQCFKKVRYRSYEKAEYKKNKCEELRPKQRLRIYPCPVCGYWHLTKDDGFHMD